MLASRCLNHRFFRVLVCDLGGALSMTLGEPYLLFPLLCLLSPPYTSILSALYALFSTLYIFHSSLSTLLSPPPFLTPSSILHSTPFPLHSSFLPCIVWKPRTLAEHTPRCEATWLGKMASKAWFPPSPPHQCWWKQNTSKNLVMYGTAPFFELFVAPKEVPPKWPLLSQRR